MKKVILDRLEHLSEAVANIKEKIQTTEPNEINKQETIWDLECELKQIANHSIYLIKTIKKEDIDIWVTRKAIDNSLKQ